MFFGVSTVQNWSFFLRQPLFMLSILNFTENCYSATRNVLPKNSKMAECEEVPTVGFKLQMN